MKNMLFCRTIAHFIQKAVLPDIETRLSNGRLSESELPLGLNCFRVFRTSTPDGESPAIVEINEEVQLFLQVREWKRDVPLGEGATAEDFEPEECYLLPPLRDDVLCPYFLGLRPMLDWRLCFDFLEHESIAGKKEPDRSLIRFNPVELDNALRYGRQIGLIEKLNILADHNWPPAPGYFPVAIHHMHQHLDSVQDEGFAEVVARAYGEQRWEEMIEFWKETKFFGDRLPYIERAVRAHFEGDYICSIYVLVPQLEGIIRSYVEECGSSAKHDYKKFVDELRRLLLSRRVVLFPKQVLERILTYLRDSSFWTDTKKVNDPRYEVNRHGIAHGIFCGFEHKVISLKYLILLDSLAYVLLHDKILRNAL